MQFLVSIVLGVQRRDEATAPRIVRQMSGHQRLQEEGGHGELRTQPRSTEVETGELRCEQILRKEPRRQISLLGKSKRKRHRNHLSHYP